MRLARPQWQAAGLLIALLCLTLSSLRALQQVIVLRPNAPFSDEIAVYERRAAQLAPLWHRRLPVLPLAAPAWPAEWHLSSLERLLVQLWPSILLPVIPLIATPRWVYRPTTHVNVY